MPTVVPTAGREKNKDKITLQKTELTLDES